MSGIRLPTGYRLLVLETIDSTNQEAKRLALSAGPEADTTVIWALRQTAGRGRRGRAWVSEPGNLLVSLLLRPGGEPFRAANLGFVAGLAMAEALESLGAAGVGLKWPNDVLLHRKKAAGILLEGAAEGWLAVGIGVNVAHHPADTEFPATSLAAQGLTVSVAGLLEALLGRFAHWRARWTDEGFAPVRTAWLERAAGLGEPLTARLGAESVSGIFRGLDGQGALTLDTASGPRTITAADIYFAG